MNRTLLYCDVVALILTACGAAGTHGGNAGAAKNWMIAMGGSYTPHASGNRREDSKTGQTLPERRVYVPDFALDRTEVTVAAYRKCVEARQCETPPEDRYCKAPNYGTWGRADHPVNCIRWTDAQAYCRFAGKRLPTGIEWEFAARSGGKEQAYPWGDAPPNCTRAVYMEQGGLPESSGGCGTGSTGPVCSRLGGNSAQGICDLGGNVSEWVQPSSGLPPAADERIDWNALFGGNWGSGKPMGGSVRVDAIGFRCAQTL